MKIAIGKLIDISEIPPLPTGGGKWKSIFLTITEGQAYIVEKCDEKTRNAIQQSLYRLKSKEPFKDLVTRTLKTQDNTTLFVLRKSDLEKIQSKVLEVLE